MPPQDLFPREPLRREFILQRPFAAFLYRSEVESGLVVLVDWGHLTSSMVTSKPAIKGHFKTGHYRGVSETGLF